MCIQKWLEDFRLNRQIKKLSDEERRVILGDSPFTAGAFQGEGFHVFLKSEPDFHKGYVTSLGEISGQAAEDWIIKQYLLQKANIRRYGPEKAAQSWGRF